MEQEYPFYIDEETKRLTRSSDLIGLVRHLHKMTGGDDRDRDTCRRCLDVAKRYIELESKGLMIW